MSSPIDTEEWGLSAFMDWKPTKATESCDRCAGGGIVGGGFKDMEGPRDCPECHGRGWRTFYPKSKKPEIPQELIEHMRSSWIAYWETKTPKIENTSMSLLDKIRADQLQARKNREADKASLLTTLIGEAAMVGKNDGNRESTDAEVTAVIRKFLKNNSENMSIAGDRRDSDWCDQLDAEREVLEVYLPKQMTEAEIMDRLKDLEKNKGSLMKYLKDNFAGQYDGKVASQVVDAYLKS